MPSGKSSSKPCRKSRKPKISLPDTVNVTELEAIGQEAANTHFRATNTSKAYQGHIKRAKAFTLKQINEEQQEITEKKGSELWLDDDDDSGEAKFYEVSSDEWNFDKLKVAWENPPNKYSSRALKMFLIYKCVVQGFGYGTAEQIRSAGIAHWDNMCVYAILAELDSCMIF